MKTIHEILNRNGLKKPNSLLTYVLFKAIQLGKINHYSIGYYGTSKRIHDLRNLNCTFDVEISYRNNSYDHPEKVQDYILTNKEFAINLYKELTS